MHPLMQLATELASTFHTANYSEVLRTVWNAILQIDTQYSLSAEKRTRTGTYTVCILYQMKILFCLHINSTELYVTIM
jgi:hypothetical protein